MHGGLKLPHLLNYCDSFELFLSLPNHSKIKTQKPYLYMLNKREGVAPRTLN